MAGANGVPAYTHAHANAHAHTHTHSARSPFSVLLAMPIRFELMDATLLEELEEVTPAGALPGTVYQLVGRLLACEVPPATVWGLGTRATHPHDGRQCTLARRPPGVELHRLWVASLPRHLQCLYECCRSIRDRAVVRTFGCHGLRDAGGGDGDGGGGGDVLVRGS